MEARKHAMTNASDPTACCTPSADRPPLNAHHLNVSTQAALRVSEDAIDIPGGTGFVGTNDPQLPVDGESPMRKVKIRPFRMGATAVTNAQFKTFVDTTGFVTEAERFGWSFVFWSQVPKHLGPTEAVPEVNWWRRVDGSNWRNINGPGTEGEAWHPDHPVVHISWNDARAYAEWAGGRLPTEAEWEHAARGGLGDVRFPWGDAEPDDVHHTPCNIWQGQFPNLNTGQDGYLTTAPAQSFQPNGYGLYNLAGNVWEWTADPYRVRSLKKSVKDRLEAMKGYKLSKGGSFLCHKSYCYRYRIAARSGNSPDSATTHHGFRMVWPMA